MATNKETMVVIAEGVGFHDPTEAEKLAGEIAVRIAFDASDNFMAATEGMKLKTVQAIVKDLEEAEPESMIAILKALFLASNMEAAVKELELLDLCSTYDEYSYDFFQDAFLDTDAIDWYCVENWLPDKNKECSKLN